MEKVNINHLSNLASYINKERSRIVAGGLKKEVKGQIKIQKSDYDALEIDKKQRDIEAQVKPLK
jgi:hypothetical protein